MLAEYLELLIPPLKTNVGYERLFLPIQLGPQITGTYTGFLKFGRSIGGKAAVSRTSDFGRD
jgi:hypothetical protein